MEGEDGIRLVYLVPVDGSLQVSALDDEDVVDGSHPESVCQDVADGIHQVSESDDLDVVCNRLESDVVLELDESASVLALA